MGQSRQLGKHAGFFFFSAASIASTEILMWQTASIFLEKIVNLF